MAEPLNLGIMWICFLVLMYSNIYVKIRYAYGFAYKVLTISVPNFRHSTDREVALMILMAYLSYIMAEVLSLWPLLLISILCFLQ